MQSTTHRAARTLVLVRHAKAESFAEQDHERELTSRGAGDAARAGEWLAGYGVVPDAALVSSAARAAQTWEALAEAAGYRLDPVLDDAMYDAGPETALDLIRGTDQVVGTLVVVGHNPTIGYLAQLLDDGEGDPDASAGMLEGYPTGALTVLRTSGAWTDLELGGATVLAFRTGRE
ncbi:SixA phosphatase family protein [Nocardioides donggukensis]|uniref:Histidine phosphatase family protein n=1 Tax=Nocardioides donggukensis TaxID=2774019 RepID=A0A927K306_9ACTN|nr:histidine phosphatase family protein [Nocardioides donggukensis]MBD8869424.1 histidine phosphatase family protein [Nocardioides donggukensis]